MLRRWGGLPAQELVQCHVWLPAFATLGIGRAACGPALGCRWQRDSAASSGPLLSLAVGFERLLAVTAVTAVSCGTENICLQELCATRMAAHD